MTEIPHIIKHLAEKNGINIVRCDLIAGQGSNRIYYRLTTSDGSTMIATTGPDLRENETFVHLTEALGERDIAVPSLIAVDDDYRCYIQQDLGNLSLYEALADARRTGVYTDDDMAVLTATIDLLADAHLRGRDIDDSMFYPCRSMGERQIMWDLNYWKYCMLKPTETAFDEERLEDAMQRFAARCHSRYSGLMLRDFQSRNIMIHDGRPYVIDYQSARRGPWAYDLVSMLMQVRAALPDDVVDRLTEHYISRMQDGCKDFDAGVFRADICRMTILRMLQVLGAYGFRGLIQGKEMFRHSIPGALATLRRALAEDGDGGYLTEIVDRLCALPQFAQQTPRLTVLVRSFSFKKGRPDDSANPHGGGFTFDCRGLHNPGRYGPYKQLNGLDSEVIEFLQAEPEVGRFISHAEALVDMTVDTYIRRGFESLTVDFACTGGQHRSVYCANAVARHLCDKYGIHVIEHHVVQDIYNEYQPVTSKH